MTTRTEQTAAIGRQQELAAVGAFLDSLPAGPAALFVAGEPGIGKSTVWRAAVDAARRRSFRLLVCRPAEAEAVLPFVALADLLEGVPEAALESLPRPQRDALEVALRRAAAPRGVDRVALARGTLAALATLAQGGSTIVAIDDAQWLDAPSRDALRFVFRRLVGRESVGLLATVRGEEAAAPLDVDAALPFERVTRIELGPLPRGDLERVVRAHRSLSLTGPGWRAVHRVSGGNPFYALQIAEAAARKGGVAPGEQPPLPTSLIAAVGERLASLGPAARRVLLSVASLGKPTVALVRAAGGEDQGLQETLAAGLLEVDGDRVRFSHPLLAAVVYGEAASAERRDVHRQLASVVAGPEERAVHLGRGTEEPDEDVAATLEAAADRAAARGAPETAAELAEHAARLTPAARVEAGARRATQAARYVGRAGDTRRSVELLRGLAARLPPGRARARALSLLGFIAVDDGALLRAIDEAAGDVELLAVAHADVSTVKLRRGARDEAVSHADAAVEAARASRDPAALAKALAARAKTEAYGRAEGAVALLEEATSLESALLEPLSLLISPTTWLGAVLLDADRLAEARRALEEAYQRGLALGLSSRAVPLTYLAEVELREGSWERAHAYSLEAAELWPGGVGLALPLVGRAIVEAHLGNVDTALAAGDRAVEILRERRELITLARAEAALGLLELSRGRFEHALDRLGRLAALPDGEPLRDAPAFRARADFVEALVGLGRSVAAEEMAQRVEESARRSGLPSRLVAAARGRALLLAEAGDAEGARSTLADALGVHAHHPEPFEHARTLLAAGAIERRAKRKADAREALEQARTTFERLGARLWSERARRELERTGLRRTSGDDLSAAERRVAEFAARGATNKEIAATLFMSVKTVEAHLSRVYRKLGVRSRTELASRLAPPGLP